MSFHVECARRENYYKDYKVFFFFFLKFFIYFKLLIYIYITQINLQENKFLYFCVNHSPINIIANLNKRRKKYVKEINKIGK